MMYTIESKSDLATGAMLVVTFPETDVDYKALATLQTDWPEFLVPFRYRSVDGNLECTYQLGSRTKLQYRFGSHNPEEYAKLWEQILQPLLDCGDWFLTPYSFVMDPQYLFVDRQGAVVSYLYIPAKTPCSDYSGLCAMAAELSRRNSVTDPGLENKVLRALMQEFQPKDFLAMLRQAVRERIPQPSPAPVQPAPAPRAKLDPVAASEFPRQEEQQMPEKERQAVQPPQPVSSSAFGEDIVIDLSGGGKKEKTKEKEKGWGLFGKKNKKPAKEEKETSPKHGGLFQSHKEPKAQELLLGAAAPSAPAFREERPVVQQQAWSGDTEENYEATQLSEEINCPCLRLIGDSTLPKEIPVDIQPGRAFTIGRFDVSVGRPQSDFEFDKRTRAVSRHHAAIERGENGYTIQDLSSSAGTFVNGEKLMPNVACPLSRGSRISFGTGGADYVWEE